MKQLTSEEDTLIMHTGEIIITPGLILQLTDTVPTTQIMMLLASQWLGHKQINLENQEEAKKVGPEYPGEGAAKTTVAGSIIDDFCIIQAKFT